MNRIVHSSGAKRFCIAGPLIPSKHYYLPERLNKNRLIELIENWNYFVLHAPRQSGKTTAITEFVNYLRGTNGIKALYINIENAQVARENFEKALIGIVSILKNAINANFPEDSETISLLNDLIQRTPVDISLFQEALEIWSKLSDKPIALFIDEIDSLIGDSLLSVLRQIRTGFSNRPDRFPQSICLIGLRDIKDYKIWSREAGVYVSNTNPFNIKTVSLTLSNFSQEEVGLLYRQHTQATGQVFTDKAIEHAYCLTQGQPWLVNALAQETCFVLVPDRNQPITGEIIERAKDILILRRDTHIDSLIDKLNEPRVARVFDAIMGGDLHGFKKDDVQYCKDLGLLSSIAPSLEIANPLYKQIIPAVLASEFQERIALTERSFVRKDGSLDMAVLIERFTQFYRENAQLWLQKYQYKESGPHLLLLAFLQRIINSGGSICREYALGTKRVDLFVRWKSQTFVLELKIKHSESVLAKGLEQTADYMDSSGSEGHLIIFDPDPHKSWDEKISHEVLGIGHKEVHVWTL